MADDAPCTSAEVSLWGRRILFLTLILLGTAIPYRLGSAQTLPSLSINSPTVTEGDAGLARLQFVVTLSPSSASRVTVAYADAGTGTATSGTDYTAVTAGTLEFAPGETAKTITVIVIGDWMKEPDETVKVTLSEPVNATLGTATGTGTITDNEAALTLSIKSLVTSQYRVLEGNSGTRDLEFHVELSGTSASAVTVKYADAGTGTAISGTDYTAVTAGTVTFASGEISKSLTVKVIGDTLDEPDETVVLQLSGPSGATVATATAAGTIDDDDSAPYLSISSPSVAEGDSGSVDLEFVVALSAASGKRVTVAYADEGLGSARSGTDYTALTAGTLTFAAGETAKTITVAVNGDELDEADETVQVTLGTATNHSGIAPAIGTGTITDDDDLPSVSISSPSVGEGQSGGAYLEFVVSLSAASGRRVAVKYADAGTGTATSGTDYAAFTGRTLEFAAGQTAKTVTVVVRDDGVAEGDETVKVTLSGPVNTTLGTATGTGTITDDEGALTLSIKSLVTTQNRVLEGNSGSRDLEFRVELSASSAGQVTVKYADAGTGTATSGTDYTAVTAGTLTFTAGQISKSLTVRVTGDTLDEPNETVVLQLSEASGATIATGTATGTIDDDDSPPNLSISSPSVAEGDSGRADLEFAVTLSAASGKEVTVAYADAGSGTATSGTDYTALTAGTLTFAAGDTAKTITVAVTGDAADEANETVQVTLGTASNAGVATATGTGTITDDDDPPTVSISSPTVAEGDSGSADLEFVVSLSAASGKRVTVKYADAGTGTATSGTDYTAVTAGTLTFAAGDTAKTVTVRVRGDGVKEADETVKVTLSAPANATLGTATGTGTITDDEAGLTLSIKSLVTAQYRVLEGNSGSRDLEFRVELSGSSTSAVTVKYADAGTGTATSGTDYTAVTAGTLTFAAGQISKSLTVKVTGDTLDEPDETVVLQLSEPSGATIATGTATGTIDDDDSAPNLSISSPSVAEGDSGSANLEFAVSLSAASGKQVTVAYADAGSGTATSGTDYTALTAGTLTFAAGDTAKTITVAVTGDTADEANETVQVTLGTASNAGVATATGTGTITDDDDPPTVSISSPSVTEGDSGSVDLEFVVSLSAASGKRVTVKYADAGSGTATSGTDYTALTSGTLTFAAGDTAKTVTVTVQGDGVKEADETVKVTLSAPVNATLGSATGTGTITDDEAGLTLSIKSLVTAQNRVLEGNSGSRDLEFRVELSATSASQVTVKYADAGTGTATSGTDYTAVTAGTLTFAAGQISKSLTVKVTGDTLDEPDETVVLQLSEPSGATIATATATGTIDDDDSAPYLSISSPSVAEGDSGSADLEFVVALSAASGKQVTVAYADEGLGSARSGADYTALTAGTLTFAAGETAKTITVAVKGDELDEADETVQVTLGTATNHSGIAPAIGTGTITDDDDLPSVSISSPSVGEGRSGGAYLEFVVTLSAASGRRVAVKYADAGTGTATSGTDYAAFTARTLEFAAGDTAKTVTVVVRDDGVAEGDETVKVTLSGPVNAALGTATGTGTITDDERALTLSIKSLVTAQNRVLEGNSGSRDLEFRVELSATSASQVTVKYADAGTGTATSGTDYMAVTAGTLTFAAGQISKALTVKVTGDTLDEPDETVVLQLSDASGATIATGTATGTIDDDDSPPNLSISSPSVAEGDSGSANLEFAVTLSAASGKQVTVAYADAGSGTATSGTDYTALTAGTLTFAAGDTAKTVTVAVTGDTADEANETVQVTLGTASNAGVATATGTGTITDDDDPPTVSISSPSVAEGDSGSADLEFVVSLSAASGKRVTVNYADAGTGTATSGSDYSAVTAGILEFAAGDTAKTVTVTVRGDWLKEPDETVKVTLSAPVNATLGTATGTGTITDNEAALTLSIKSLVTAQNRVLEGNSGSRDLEFHVELSGTSASAVTVAYADAGTGTAVSGTDYTAVTGGTLTFASGEISKALTVKVTGDTLDEPDETVVLQLSDASGATIATGTATGTIDDDDSPPNLSISSPSVTEGDSGSANLEFAVTLSAASGKQVTVAYADAGSGTATSGTDYTALTAGTLTFAAGDTAKTITVAVTGDAADEANETVQVTLGTASNAGVATATGTGTITDDDDPPTVSISSPSVAEGNSGSADLEFVVSLSAASGKRVTVAYADAGTGTATSGSDYSALTAGTLEFAAGDTAKTVTVTVRGDGVTEGDETVKVTLSVPVNATLGTATGTGTITDDEAALTLSIKSLVTAQNRVLEGNSGSRDLEFRVELSGTSASAVTVKYADAGTGTATSGTDYTAVAAGTLTFASGQISKALTVKVTGDTLDETVVLQLSDATGATIATGAATGTIDDDDSPPNLSISSPSVAEGDSGSANLEFAVTLSAASGKQVTVAYADAGSGTATSGTDYTLVTARTLTFAAGDTAKTITIAVKGDTADETNETVQVTLGTASNAGVAMATGTGTITDDDDPPALSISSPSAAEGDSGGADLEFVVTLSAASGKRVTVKYADVGSGTATSGTDYTVLAAGTLTFAAGETAKTITVAVTGDTLNELDETVKVSLSEAGNASIGTGTGTGTITDDDSRPALSISSPSVGEGDSGSANLEFAVTLSGATALQVTVAYADAGSGTATSGADYVALAAGTLTFAVGDTAKTITVAVRGDALDEADETVKVSLSGASNAGIGTGTGTGTITDDDDAPSLSISSPSVSEGDSGSVNLEFAVTLGAASGRQVTVAYADAGSGTATSGTDYTALAAGTLTFVAGDTAETITVAVMGDALDEADETVKVSLSGASNAGIGTATGTGTITDDDDAPSLSISSPSVGEGDSGSADLEFEVTLSAASGKRVTVAYADAGSGTAMSGTDYTALAAGTLTFAAGETAKTVTVAVTGDTLNELDETVKVSLSGAGNASIGTGTGTGTITDDDARPAISISSPSVGEGDSGSANLEFAVTLSGASALQVTVEYADAGSGTATSGTDYTAFAAGTLTFAAGETAKTVTVAVTGDSLDEVDETVKVTLSAASNAGIGTGTGTGTITDDDDAPTLSISSPSVAEGGESGNSKLEFAVTLSGASAKQVTVEYADAGSGTATSGTDYTALAAGTLTFAAGDTAKTITVAVIGDFVEESNETVKISLSSPVNATLAVTTGTGEITNDDSAETNVLSLPLVHPAVSISSPSAGEGDSGTTNLGFVVTLSAATRVQVTVAYADAGSGTATSGTDYTALTAGTLTFAAGETAKTVTVAVRGDTLDEADETVKLTLSGPTNSSIGTGTGTGTITDDDDAPTLSISTPSVGEGDSGSASLEFAVTLGAASGKQVTVAYADAGTGTATSGTDYTALAAGTLTFAAGETAKTITVAVQGDALDEANETVKVTLSGASNAGIGTATGTGTITDDDDAPTLSISSPSVGEGDSGSANLEFAVTLGAASGKQVTVAYADAGTGTATSGTDYTALAAGTLTFAAGETAKTVTVAVTGDTLNEADETVKLSLSEASNASIGTGTGTGTITDDDTRPSLSISSPSVGEGDSGSASLEFAVTLSGASALQITVDYADAGSGTATSGTDYTALTAGTLTFAAGETAKTITVAVQGDALDEANETVKVTLSEASNAGIGTATGTGTITDDDDAPTLSISSPSVGEGDSGSADLEFAVTLGAASGKQVTVAYADAGTGTATSGTDYTALAAGALTFLAGETAKTVTVAVQGDALDEANETVKVTLSGASNAGIGTATGTGTITDDDDAPTLSISSPSVGEGDSGSADLEFAVTLGAASGKQVTVAYADAGTGTATSGTDYTALAAGTLTFAAGETAKTVTVAVTGDTLNETDETVKVSLSEAINASIGTGTGTGTITDDDTRPSLSVSSPSVGEGDSGSADLEFAVTLSGASALQITVDYADAGSGTATSGTDYTALTAGTLTFAAGETAKTITVAVQGDALDEANETVKVTLSGASNAGIGTATGTGTITDDDDAPTLSISSPSVGEGDSGSANLEFAVTLGAASGKQVTVAYADAGTGTATSGTDYTALTAGTLTFAAGETAKTVTVAVQGDALDEANETVTLSLSGASNAGIGAATGMGTITDDDDAPTLSISSPSVGEGDSGSANLEFAVTLGAASGKQVTVAYADAGTGTATSGTDYTALTAGTLTFAAGETAKTVTVAVTGDTLSETDETVKVSLSGASNASIGTGTGTGTITDDDSRPAISISSPSVGEGDSGSADLEFAVTLSGASALQVTVAYTDAGTGTATSGTDYTALTAGTLTFAAGATAKTITVAVQGDALDEANETVKVSLSGASNAGIGTATGTGTITDDDDAPALSISSPSVVEGDSGSAGLEFAVTLGAASGKQVTVAYADAGTGTATAGTDYTALAAGTLTFAAGETAKAIAVAVQGDTSEESNETVQISLSSPVNATLAVATGTGVITNDDGVQSEVLAPEQVQPTLSISSPSVGEGDSGSADLEFVVTLSAASALQVTVAYADAGTGTATAGTDYTALAAGMLTFAAGETAKTVTVAAIGDTEEEGSETVHIGLNNPVNATLAVASGIGVITDDDDVEADVLAPEEVAILKIDSPSATEGNSGSSKLVFTVSLAPASERQVTVAFADSGQGSATSGEDYAALTAGVLTFAPGVTSQTIDVFVSGDTQEEPDETVQVMLQGAANAMIQTATGVGTILNDDGGRSRGGTAPSISISSPSVIESDSGETANLAFTITLNEPSTQVITVEYADAGTGTATAGTDYVALPNGTLTFASGQTSKAIEVRVIGDSTAEADETLHLRLSGATNSEISESTGTGTIIDDDSPSISIDSPSVAEGDSGMSLLSFSVTLSAASANVVAVSYADSGSGTATPGKDYEAFEGGMLTFAAGETRQTVAVAVAGDALVEANETVVIELSSPANATIATATGTGTITDDDRSDGTVSPGSPDGTNSSDSSSATISIDSPSVMEGHQGLGMLTFTVSLEGESEGAVAVPYSVAATSTAESGRDFEPLPQGTLRFASGETSQTLVVPVIGDKAVEMDETVVIELGQPTNATILTGLGIGTIIDDDALEDEMAELQIDSPEVAEGAPGTLTTLNFVVSLGALNGRHIKVLYEDSRTGSARSGEDDLEVIPGTLTFTDGDLRKVIAVTVMGDQEVEPDETIQLALSTEGSANGPTLIGTATIANDDHSPVDPGDGPVHVVPALRIDSPSLQEGPSGTTSILEFTVSLSTPATEPVTVNYMDSGSGTATVGADYEALPAGALTFAAGEISKLIALTVIGDDVDEPDETVVVTLLADPENGREAAVRGTATIVDDEVDLVPTFGDATIAAQVYVEGTRIDPLDLPVATSGTGDLTYSLSPIPPDGLGFNPINRRLSGTPAVPQEAAFYEYTVTDEDGDTATLPFSIEVTAAGVVARRRLGGVNRALLPEVARAWTQVTSEAVAGRVERVATGADESDVGQSLAAVAETLHRSEHALDTAEERRRSRMELAGTQPFSLNLGGAGGARIGVWGDGDFRGLSGELSPLGWSGTTYAGSAGVDVRMGSTMLAGLAASRFASSFDYRDRSGDTGSGGTHTSRITGFHPYVGWTAGGGSRLWATAGLGSGAIEIDDEEHGNQVSDGRLRSGAVGGRFRLYSTGEGSSGTQLNLRAEGMFGHMEVDGNGDLIDAVSVGVHRVRAAVEGSKTFGMGNGRTMTPAVAFGMRRDGGDGRTGTGAELSGRVDYADPATGFGVEANGRVLLAHTGDAGEWGFGAAISFDPGQDGRGLAFKVEPRLGTAENGMQRLWDEGMVDARRFADDANVPMSRSESEVGYGLQLDRRCLLTPYSGFSIGGQGFREYRLGSRLEIGPDFGLSLESSRRERERMMPDYRLAIEMRLAW